MHPRYALRRSLLRSGMARNDIRTLHVPIAPPLPPAEPPEPPEEPDRAADSTQTGPALALQQFLGMGACGVGGSGQRVSQDQPTLQAGDSSCPQCQAKLSRVEQRMGRCLSCGQALEPPGVGAGAEQRPGFTVRI